MDAGKAGPIGRVIAGGQDFQGFFGRDDESIHNSYKGEVEITDHDEFLRVRTLV